MLDDLPEWIGGGFSAGEFLLRSDGVLLRRTVISEHSEAKRPGGRAYGREFHRFTAGTSHGQARAWLIHRLLRPRGSIIRGGK